MSGISLLAISACTSAPPTPSPTVPTVPSTVPGPVAFQRTSWSNDPFAYGAASYEAVGSSPESRIALRQSIDGRLFFAGEATSDANPGTVYGARASGMRAALEVADAAEPGERVAVIGAGIAGATAARRLSDEGYNVVVIEGRDRAGGRIHSIEGDDWPFPIELGAAEVRDPAATMVSELDRLGIGTVAAPSTAELRTESGDVIEPVDIGQQAVAEALAWAVTQPRDTSVADALRESGAGGVDSTPSESGVSDADRLAHYLQADIASEQAADPADLSAWYASDPLAAGGEENRLVVGGFQQLITDALTDLDVLPSSTVVAVTATERGVSLRLARGESLSADRVVVTVPLGVLKAGAIEFEPPLPFSHRAAIDVLGMGKQDKLILRFEKPFWSTDATRWDIVGTDTDFPLWYNLEPLTGEPVLVALFGGEIAERLAESTDAEILEAALAGLEPFIDQDVVGAETSPTD